MEEPKRVVGVTQFFNSTKGWGFVETDKGESCFIHYTDIESGDDYRTLEAGDRVEFEIKKEDKGLKAKRLHRI